MILDLVDELGIKNRDAFYDIRLIFDDSTSIYKELKSSNKTLFIALCKRYNDRCNISMINDRLFVHRHVDVHNNKGYKGCSGQFTLDDYLDRLPYTSIKLLRFLIICMVTELENKILTFNKDNINESAYKVVREFRDIIKLYTNKLREYWVDPLDVVIATNPYTLAGEILPNYKEVMLNKTYKEYWPFKDNLIELLLSKFGNYSFSTNTVQKLGLMCKDQELTYGRFKMNEAISLKILLNWLRENTNDN